MGRSHRLHLVVAFPTDVERLRSRKSIAAPGKHRPNAMAGGHRQQSADLSGVPAGAEVIEAGARGAKGGGGSTTGEGE